MRTLAFSALWLLLGGCATLDSPPPLSGAYSGWTTTRRHRGKR